MKKRITVLVILLCVISTALLPLAAAVPSIYFSAINDKLLPFKAATMPRYIGGKFYLHYSFFSSNELGVYFERSSDENIILLYSGSKRLTFDVARGTTFDQDMLQYRSAKISDGAVFVPAQDVCDFFGFELSEIYTDIGSIIRVRSASAVYNNPTFASRVKSEMQKYYDEYTKPDNTPSPDASPSPSVSTPSEEPENSPETDYDDITIYLSFRNLSAGSLDIVLDKLDQTNIKCTFFVTVEEISSNADLLRRIACSGHSIGIFLTGETYDEYSYASSLLFEAAKLKTLLVTSDEDTAQAAGEMAGASGLVYWSPTREYHALSDITTSGVTSKLSTVHGSRESISFDCSKGTTDILRSVLTYLTQNKYNIQRITETSVPIQIIE